MHRYAALWFRFLKTDWFVNRHPEMKDSVFVFYEQTGGRAIISACNPKADEAGLYIGMALADARAMVPEIEVFEDIPDLDRDILDNIARWTVRFTPQVMPEIPDGILLDITGCAHLFGGEHNYLKNIVTKILKRGYHVRGAIADTIGAAWAVSRYARKDPIVPIGAQRQVLSPLPIAALRLNDNALADLHKMGIKTVQALDKIPHANLNRRFSSHVTQRLMQAFGKENEILKPSAYAADYSQRLACPEGIVTYEGIAEGLEILLDSLCERLEFENKGVRQLEFECLRFDGGIQKVSIGTTFPSRDRNHLFGLFDNKITNIDPGSGIEVFVLHASCVETLSTSQASLLAGSDAPEKDVLQLADRVASRFGRDPIFNYRPQERHWPERSVKSGPVAVHSSPWPSIRRPIRLLARPEAIEVTSPLPDYPPMLFRHQGVLYRVRKADGPERIEGEWWEEDVEARDYYCVEDERGARYWLFRSGNVRPDNPAQWYLHGYFS